MAILSGRGGRFGRWGKQFARWAARDRDELRGNGAAGGGDAAECGCQPPRPLQIKMSPMLGREAECAMNLNAVTRDSKCCIDGRTSRRVNGEDRGGVGRI